MAALVAGNDRGAAIDAMARGAAEVVRRLHADGALDGILGLGGSGNSTIVAQAMRALPVGVPKLLVSTVASGDTRPYVGAVDIAMMYSVVDIAGDQPHLGADHDQRRGDDRRHAAKARVPDLGAERPLIGASDVRRHDALRDGRARAARGARLRGARVPRDRRRWAVDGGARARRATSPACSTRRRPSSPTSSSAACSRPGPTASRRPGAQGLPQVVSLGALDMVNFGPRETVPMRFDDRNLYVHNADRHADAHHA